MHEQDDGAMLDWTAVRNFLAATDLPRNGTSQPGRFRWPRWAIPGYQICLDCGANVIESVGGSPALHRRRRSKTARCQPHGQEAAGPEWEHQCYKPDHPPCTDHRL